VLQDFLFIEELNFGTVDKLNLPISGIKAFSQNAPALNISGLNTQGTSEPIWKGCFRIFNCEPDI
jgi:hypothetical protein